MELNQHNDNSESVIQRFYSKKSVFITGGLGYLGKILIEKLLRSCPEISTIYLLGRPKKSKSSESRLDEVFQTMLFDRVREEMPNFREKIVLLTGDLNLEDMGFPEEVKTLLINEVNDIDFFHLYVLNDKSKMYHALHINSILHQWKRIKIILKVSVIFHVAATTRFNEALKTAIRINIHGTRSVLNLAKHMKNLKAFIHVSTLYAHCYKNIIEEHCYTLPIDTKCLVNLTKDVAEDLTIQVPPQWPNTYTFTKAVAETLIKNEGTGLPIGIVRPSIVMPCANEPFVGWIDNYIGPMGIATSYLCGLLKFIPSSGNFRLPFVPVDITINTVITSAWDVSNHLSRNDNEYTRNDNDILIYNCAPLINAPTFKEYIQNLHDYYEAKPINNILWLPTTIYIPHIILYKICTWLTYFPIALFSDAIRISIGRRPKMWNLCEKCLRLNDVISYFINNEWTVTNKNVEAMWNRLSEKDQQMFTFNMKEFDWTHYFKDVYEGVRFYLFKEDDSTLERAHIKRKRFCWIHRILLIVFNLLILFVAWNIFCKY